MRGSEIKMNAKKTENYKNYGSSELWKIIKKILFSTAIWNFSMSWQIYSSHKNNFFRVDPLIRLTAINFLV